MLKKAMIVCSLLLLMMAACSPAVEEATATPTEEAEVQAPTEDNSGETLPEEVEVAAPTQLPTIEVTETINEPTSTPIPVVNPPAMELLSGAPDSCVNAEDYGRVLGFDARAQNITTDHFLVVRLSDSEGNVLAEDAARAENRDGEEGYGFYPVAYEVPENSELTVELTVYLSEADDAPASSYSIIVFDCTTGEVFASNFQQYEP